MPHERTLGGEVEQIITWLMSIALLLVAIAVFATLTTVLVKRRGEKKLTKLQVGEQAKNPTLDPNELKASLAENSIDHEMFVSHFSTHQREFFISTDQGGTLSALLLERLHSLDDTIAWQLNEDRDWMNQLEEQDRHIVERRHHEWRVIQERIKEMIAWTPDK
jgi:flagellar biosynthesis/type III secretory pathway M-ring protein FliF/YscJ